MTRRETRYHAQYRVFVCSVCGARVAAPKWKGRTGVGHIKTMYCFRCRERTEHQQTE